MQAIVLVGGEGTRLRPLTSDVPKPALTLVDRPFLAFVIEWLAAHGVSEVVLACGFLPDVLREALGEDEPRACAIAYVVEPEPRGTAGAIRFAADALGERLEDRFLALNGDVLADLDLGALLRAHEERGARATIGLHPVEDSSAYGLVRCDGERRGDRVPREDGRGGARRDQRRRLRARALGAQPDPGGPRGLDRARGLPAAGRRRPLALRLDGYWMDIGTPERYLQASWDILEGRVRDPGRAHRPGLHVAADAEIAADADVGPRAVLGRAASSSAGRGRRLGPARRLHGPRARRSATRSSPRGPRSRPGAVLRDTSSAEMKESPPEMSALREDVLTIPAQLRDALWRIESARLEPVEAAGLIVCGMGGSAIGGDLAAAALGDRLTRPLMTIRGYELPSWATPEWTVLCSSYSGKTEETLACFEAAEALGARRIVLSTGGAAGRGAARRASRSWACRGSSSPAPRSPTCSSPPPRRRRWRESRRASTPRSTPPPPSSSARPRRSRRGRGEIAAELDGRPVGHPRRRSHRPGRPPLEDAS